MPFLFWNKLLKNYKTPSIFHSCILIKFNLFKNTHQDLRKLTIKDLWPIWINEYIKLKSWTDKHAYQRRYALGNKYIFPVIGSYKPNQISIENIVDCLELAMKHTEQTHLKVLVALSQFLRWSTAKKLRNAKNRLPTDITLIEPYLGMRLRKPCGHHPSVDWRDIPLFISLLLRESSISAKALLFTILTASRLQSVCQARWSEVNFTLNEWQIPAFHMKGKQGHNRPHDVPLSTQARNVIYSLAPASGIPTEMLIFSATGNVLSGTALRKLIRKIDKVAITSGHRGFKDPLQNNRVAVTHGFRASFATWAQETGQDMSVVERCLSHVDPNDRYHSAYRRGQMSSQRKNLLQKWADYCYSEVELNNATDFKNTLGH